MRTFFIVLFIAAITVAVGYAQRNTGGSGDDGRLGHDGKSKVGEPKTDPRNPPDQNPGTRPPHDNTPIRPIEGGTVAPPIYPPCICIVQPDVPPSYDPDPIPSDYPPPAYTGDKFVDYKALGKNQFDDENYFAAIESFKFALARDTSDYSLYYQLGISQIAVGSYSEAIHSLSKFIRSVTYNGLGYYQRGLAKFYLGNKDNALNDFLIADQLQVQDVKLILKRFYNY